MPGAVRVTVDAAGGVIVGNLAPTVFVNGVPIGVKGATVQGHGKNEHRAPVMVGASGTVLANGIPVSRAGDAATCGHTASGSADVIVG